MRLTTYLAIASIFFSGSVYAQATQKPIAKKPAVSKPKPKPVGMTNQDVIDLVNAGFSEELILNQIGQTSTKSFDLSTKGLIALKTAGVSENIISEMMGGKSNSEIPKQSAVVPAVMDVPKSAPVAVGHIEIPDGTEVKLRLLETVSSSTAKTDDRVRFEAVDDILVDGKVVIAKGSQARGVVTEAERKKSFGRGGKLDFTIDSVKAVDGQDIRLRASRERRGDENYAKAGVLTFVFLPAGLFIRGKDVEVKAGTEFAIFIDGERRINLKPVASR